MYAKEGFASPLAKAITRFVEHKRVLGRRYETEVYALRLFDRYLVERRVDAIDSITPEHAPAALLRPALEPPRAALRSHAIPAPEPGLFTLPPAPGDQQALPLDSAGAEPPRSGRARWGWLIGHVFLADLEHCSRCGGPMRWVEAATRAEAISRLLAKHGLAPWPPPHSRWPPIAPGQLSFAFARSAR